MYKGTSNIFSFFFKVMILCFLKLKKKRKKRLWGGVWFVFSNHNFQFLNNISRIFIHFFTHTYFHKCFQFLNNNFQFLNTYIKRAICFVFSLFGRLERNNPNYKLVKMVNNDQRETRLRNLLPKIFPFIIGLKKGKPSSSVLIRLQY